MIGLFLVTHGTLGEALIQCVCHVLDKRPPLLGQLVLSAGEDPADALPLARRMIATVEAEHEKRYLKLLSRLTDGNFFKRDGKIWWQCRNCGYVCEASEAPQMCPACKHPQAYFEPKKENY